MRRTLPTFNTFLQHEIDSWAPMRRTLRAEDKTHLDRLFTHARTFAAEGTAAARPVPFDAVAMGMMIGLARELAELSKEVGLLRGELNVLRIDRKDPGKPGEGNLIQEGAAKHADEVTSAD